MIKILILLKLIDLLLYKTVDSPIISIYALNEPSIVTETESNALKYVFEQLIWDGLNEEKN